MSQTTTKTRKSRDAKPKQQTPHQTKTALLRAMLEHKDGATLDALCAATGWQAHTVRAALSRLRKAGREIDRAKTNAGISTYSITTSTKAQP